MNTTVKNQIKKEDLSVMEELVHQCNFQVKELEAICPATVFGWDVELEVYPPGESYPSYFRVHYHLFSEFVDTYFSDNNIESYLTDQDYYVMKNDEVDRMSGMYWYQNLASEKEQLEVTNYVINQLFNQLF